MRGQEDELRGTLDLEQENQRLAGELAAARSELVNLRQVLASTPQSASPTLGELVAESKAKRGRARAAA